MDKSFRMLSNRYPKGVVVALFIGKPEIRWLGKAPSAIAKRPVAGPLMLEQNGFAGDVQADQKVHGGPEKAVHHYPSEHMEFWKQDMPEHDEKFVCGCFGENVSTSGLDERNVCLGDIVEMGTAKLQVLQGRQPCWKLNAHMEIDDLANRFIMTGKTGWYYRVLENGVVNVGDMVTVKERNNPEWTLENLISAFFDKQLDTETCKQISEIPSLSKAWKDAFVSRSGSQKS